MNENRAHLHREVQLGGPLAVALVALPAVGETMNENHFDELPGRDLESRARLYRVVQVGAPFALALQALPPEAAARIGMSPEKIRDLERAVGNALWASTADLHQRGEDDFAAQVVARAQELAEKKEEERP